MIDPEEINDPTLKALIVDAQKALDKLLDKFTKQDDDRRYLVNRAIKLLWQCEDK